jgi:hypothetical protein
MFTPQGPMLVELLLAAPMIDRSAHPARTYATGLAGAAGRRDAYATWRFL